MRAEHSSTGREPRVAATSVRSRSAVTSACARLGSIDLALQSLERAVNLQPTLRGRAQHDHDLAVLRNDPEYERIIFAQRA